ncbi:MAG TPA: T9SS type A sorting domain-containing protein [Flavobacteriales bacterium]|nr:T9SS type A sorting domain-containing protein [Flavobacteriales bacterium]
MKHVLTLLAFCLHLSPLGAQTLLQSGLETWSEGLPTGFVSSQTTFPTANIQQVNTPVHGGTSAMRLDLSNDVSGLLTTAPLIVTAERLYEVRFWVQGTGLMHIGLYDGRSENAGFSPLTAPVEVNSTSWQFVIRTVLCANSTLAAEFAFDLAANGEGSFLVIDDVTITTSTLPTATPVAISQIQESNLWNGASPLNFSYVRTEGVITGLTPNSYYLQEGSGAWKGIEVRSTPLSDWATGHRIRVLGTVAELTGFEETWPRGRTQLISVQHSEVVSTGNAAPSPTLISAWELQEEDWESVLVQVQDLECLSTPDPETNAWTAANWQGTLTVDSLFYLHSPTLGDFYTITGIAIYQGTTVLAPRAVDDIGVGVGLEERSMEGVRVWPNPASDVVNIAVEDAMLGMNYTLVDATGRTVLTGTLNGSGPAVIPVQHLQEGAYLLQVGDEKSFDVMRVLVSR